MLSKAAEHCVVPFSANNTVLWNLVVVFCSAGCLGSNIMTHACSAVKDLLNQEQFKSIRGVFGSWSEDALAAVDRSQFADIFGANHQQIAIAHKFHKAVQAQLTPSAPNVNANVSTIFKVPRTMCICTTMRPYVSVNLGKFDSNAAASSGTKPRACTATSHLHHLLDCTTQ